MRKKILYIITKGNFGGAQRYVFDMARYMDSEFDVVVATGEAGLLNTKLQNLGISTREISNLKRNPSLKNDIMSVQEIRTLLKEERPDIVHLNSSKAGFNGALALAIHNLFSPKDSRVKIVFTAHGWAFNETRSLFSKLLFYILHTITILLSDVTIAVSHASKKDMSFLPSLESSMVVIHNGVEEETHLPKSKSRSVLFPESKHSVWIGTISELHTNKGLDLAITALEPILKNHPEIGFYIAGSGEKEDALKKQVSDLGLEESVVFLGYVDNARQYLKAFDVFTLTSRTENFPYVLLEAGLASNPVIATNVGGISEVIKNLETGMLIRPQSTKDINHAVTYALEHRTESQDYGKSLRATVKKHFLVKQMVTKTRKLYMLL